MISITLTQLRLRASGSLRWVCCFVLVILILLRFWGPLQDTHAPILQESALQTGAGPEGQGL